MSNFSVILRQLRKDAQLTQPELARRLGISRSAVSMYELGSREPGFETLEAIADAFNVDMNTLIGGDAPPPQGEVRAFSDEDIMFALWGDTKEVDKDDLEDVKRYAAFIRERKRKE